MNDWRVTEAHRSLQMFEDGLRAPFRKDSHFVEFMERLDAEIVSIFSDMFDLYGWRWDFSHRLEDVLTTAAAIAADRSKGLRRRDRRPVSWLFDQSAVWAMTYVDRFTGTVDRLPTALPHLRSLGVTHLHLMPPYRTPDGPDDGGYAVSDYRSLRDDLGTIDDLRAAISELADDGVATVLDFVANHTADDHPWAEAAKAGDPEKRAFYFIHEDRTVPDRFAPHLRAIFPDRGGDAFSWRDDVMTRSGGAWVWTTFYPFQWDLDYRNPSVLAAMLDELGFIANLGVSAVRFDATPFLWKIEGTSCENLPETHTLIRLFSSLLRCAAPSTVLLSEAIVHPDEVVRFVRPDEARLGYNPLVMATTWEAVATRDASLLRDALSRRCQLPPGCQWITYLRCHDDIGWGFADEDAVRLGIDPVGHRRFLNAFYAGDHPASFARGMRFQDDPETGDARISGTLASLAGWEAALESADPGLQRLSTERILAMHVVMLFAVGIPLLYLGDEIAQINDVTYLDDSTTAQDNRWAHRPPFDWQRLGVVEDGLDPASRLLGGIRDLIELRKRSPGLDAPVPTVVAVDSPSVVAWDRWGDDGATLVAVNLADEPAETVFAVGDGWRPALPGTPDLGSGRLRLGPYGVGIWWRSDEPERSNSS